MEVIRVEPYSNRTGALTTERDNRDLSLHAQRRGHVKTQ